MIKPPDPLDETARLVGLHSMRILDTPTEERYDRITRIAQRLFDVEICLVSLVDAHRQWFKSKLGLEACETNREVSFCGHAIADETILVVRDAFLDERFADNPLVTGEPFIRFYAGCPLHAPTGHRIGTLCLIDKQPRDFSHDDQSQLRDLASLIDDEFRLASQVSVDGLTQLANRRGFDSVASQIIALCDRVNANCELVVFDLDGFKEINDTHGHGAGDRVLRHFSRLLIQSFRSADVIARIGGDEFGLLMTASRDSSDVALARLEAMADREKCPIKRKLAWSVGKATYDPNRHDSLQSLLADADGRMYREKAKRRTAVT